MEVNRINKKDYLIKLILINRAESINKIINLFKSKIFYLFYRKFLHEKNKKIHFNSKYFEN